MRKTLLAVLFCLMLVLLPRQAYAETEIYDFSESLSEYAQAVAILNQPLPGFHGMEGRELFLPALLCRTDGRVVDFEPTGAICVLEGPDCCCMLYFATEEQRDKAVLLLNRTEGIRYAEADCEVQACSDADMSFLSWGAEEMSFGAFVPYANANGCGSAVVAVVDSGCYPHPLLTERILTGGMDYVDGDWDTTNDLFGHGTNVAGIIVDCTPDSPVYLYPIRVLNSSGGGKMSNVVNAVREATQTATIINMSLESAVMSVSLDDAVREAVASGIVVVAAAGNSNKNTSDVCPAHLDDAGVIVVGAADGSGDSWKKASYSNYGTSVDLYAPGTGIRCCSQSGGYISNNGTSMAAPHISGACALLQVLYPGIGPAEVEYRLCLTAEDETLPVPNLLAMIPQPMHFSLTELMLEVGDEIRLPSVQPLTACEQMTLTSSDESVVSVQDNSLVILTPGSAEITCSCFGLEDVTFRIIVSDTVLTSMILPEELTIVEEEAFLGDGSITNVIFPDTARAIRSRAFDDCPSLNMVLIPPSVTEIEENTFSGAVIFCQYGSAAYTYAIDNALSYIAFDEWL